MSTLVIATSEADAAAAAAVEQHHAEMSGALAVAVERLVAAVGAGDPQAVSAARDDLVGWCRTDLLPHAVAEERALYPAAHAKDAGRLLVEGMLAEHAVLTGLVDELTGAAEPVRAAGAATALRVLFDAHLAKENDLVLPLLVAAADVSVADLLDGMHETLGGGSGCAGADEHGQGHACGCGETDAAGYPELDARAVPHAIRHATIFGALDGVRPGGGLVLVAPHDPLPMLAQLERRSPGTFTVEYLQRGPEAWRLQLVRRSA